MDHITVVTFNCRGLRKLLMARRRLFGQYMDHLRYDFIGLQETHASDPSLYPRLDLALQVSSSLWPTHCGHIYYNQTFRFIYLELNADGVPCSLQIFNTATIFTNYVLSAAARPAHRGPSLTQIQSITSFDRSPPRSKFFFFFWVASATTYIGPSTSWKHQHWCDLLHCDPNTSSAATFDRGTTIDFLLTIPD